MVMGTQIRDIRSTMSEFHPNQFFSGNKLPKPQTSIEQDESFFHIYGNQAVSVSSNASPEGESHDDSDIFADIALSYISQMLNDEDDNIENVQALEATEKPFYDILAEKYPPSSLFPPPDSSHDSASPDSTGGGGGGGSNSSGVVGNHWPYDYSDYQPPVEGFAGVSDLFLEPGRQFNRGVEEARKFLPSDDKLGLSLPLWPKEEDVSPSPWARGRKNPHSDDDLEEGRRVKQPAVSSDETIRSEDFDDVLLCHGCFPKAINDLREALQHVANQSVQANGGKGRGKRQPKTTEVVDLRTLLVHCAQMAAADDHRSTGELLKQIRQHSSQHGDGSQRLAHYFANGLEARLVGNGGEIYNSYKAKRKTAIDFLKAQQLYLAACPFKKISYFYSNQSILKVSEKAKMLHIIDFGIGFGFQWPSFIQCISSRPGGPPALRITGIDVPQPGFRPAETVEQTGRRLADYARSFNVPFEYKAIVSKWEDVGLADLDIRGDEVLVVNCLYQMKHLADESVTADSPRNAVLSTIRRMKPTVFVLGIVNGSYSAPFFVTRFREALYHFSALYDMLETIVPRENEQRLLIEREIFGREVLNVVACEGAGRRERPETYKQWQARNLRAGLRQRPMSQELLGKAREKVKDFYHKDFCVDEDGRWLLQGWKGRIVYALSSWVASKAL